MAPSLLSSLQAHDGTVELKAAGAWTASNAAELERLVKRIATETDRSQATAIDMRGVEHVDTYGALLLDRPVPIAAGPWPSARIIGLECRYQGLLRQVQQGNPRLPKATSHGSATVRALESLGSAVSEFARDIAIFIDMVGALTMAVLRLLRQPTKFRLTSAVHHLDRVGWQAVPIILLITFLIGGIIDTVVSIDFQGLTGSPVISLIGGTSERPLVAENGQMPILIADAASSQSMSQAARDLLRRFDELLAENAQPLRSLIGNLDTFASALARNSDHLDGIVAGLERMTGGAAAKARLVTYDLTAPRAAEAAEKPSATQLVVLDPTALAALDTERVQSASANGAFANLPDAQWSDALPKLVQTKILRSVADAGRFSGVSRPLEGLAADLQLVLDIRKFQLAANGTADVEFGCKIVAGNGRIIATRVFRPADAAEAASAPAAVAALDRAFGQAGSDLVAWVGPAANEPPLPKAVLPRRTNGG